MLEENDLENDESIEEKRNDTIFSGYRFQEVIPGCLPHPADIVESSSLAAIDGPAMTYPIQDSIPEAVVKSGKLSCLQLEAIIYACQRHLIKLNDGCRAGFFIGDSAGVGKGRQIAGIMLDNYARGRKKHVWFSISTDLIVDAMRDLSDINCYLKVIDGCKQLDKQTKVFGLSSDFKEGILFSTYATLISATNRKTGLSSSKVQRLDQLISWCGGSSFDGCLVFDECHKAKQFVPENENASTKVATAVMEIQRLLPNARVVYCSATGVSDVKNMAFMERLGLWGYGTQFKNFSDFLETIHKRGLGAAEMMAMEMKSSGLYLSRSLSFKETEFCTLEIDLTSEQIQMYDKAVKLWEELKKSLITALQLTNSTNFRVWSVFWSAHQRFFKQLCLGLKVDGIIKEAEDCLSRGFCVVIGLQSTGEASLQSEVLKQNNNSNVKMYGLKSTCAEILRRFIDVYFPTDVNGLNDSQNNEAIKEQNQWCVQAKNLLLGFVDVVKLPNCFLDEIIDRLGGSDNVAEMTGRRSRIVRKSNKSGEKPMLQQRCSDDPTSMDSLNVQERNWFMQGKKLVAIISDAASTGISLHSDANALNQCRRLHLTVELPWSADKAVQQFGRSHRSNQTSGPFYKLVTTNLGGERRFAAAVARRLQSLGALTKGDRRAATGADLMEFDLDTIYGRQALRAMYTAICWKTIVFGVDLNDLSIDNFNIESFHIRLLNCLFSMELAEQDSLTAASKVKDKDLGNVGKFLNRILGLRVGDQNLIFMYFLLSLKAQISIAKKEGRFNEGLVDLVAASIHLVGEKEVFKSLRTNNLNPIKHLILLVDRGVSWTKAVDKLSNNPEQENGFYCLKNDARRNKHVVLAIRKDGNSSSFKITRPNVGGSTFDEERIEFLNKHVKLDSSNAEPLWTNQFLTSAKTCFHGVNCKNKLDCTAGLRLYKLHLLCGGTMMLMRQLETVLARYASNFKLSKAETSMKVIRAQIENGRRIVGIRYPHMMIPIAERFVLCENNPMLLIQQQRQQAMMISDEIIQTEKSGSDNPSLVQENVTPVNSKLLAKATNPPVTLHNFFTKKVDVTELTSTQTAQENIDDLKEYTPCKKILSSPSLSKSISQKDLKISKDKPKQNSKSHSNSDFFSSVPKKLLKNNIISKNLINESFASQQQPIIFLDCDDDFREENSSTKSKHGNVSNLKAIEILDEEELDATINIGASFENNENNLNLKYIDGYRQLDSKKVINDIENDGNNLNIKQIETKKAIYDIENDLSVSDFTENNSNLLDVRSSSNSFSRYTNERVKTPLSTGKKRKLNSEFNLSKPDKIQKQTTVFKCFEKQVIKNNSLKNIDNEGDKKSNLICPICNYSFDCTISNLNLNKHISNCIIE